MPQRQYAKAQKEIARLSRESALDDEDLSDTLAQLTRTTGNYQKGLKGTALAANIARARNISLAAATKIVEKANVGQLRGLKSVGVQIDKNTTTSEALDDAQRKFAGSAEAYGKTAAAAQERLGVAFENLQETVGSKLLPILQRLAIRLTEIITSVEKNWPEIEKTIKDSVAVIRPVIKVIVEQIKGVANIVIGIVRTIRAVKDGDWKAVWDGIVQIAVDGVFAIVKAVLTLPAKIISALGSTAWNQLKLIGSTIKDNALAGLEGLGDAVVKTVQDAINRMVDILNKAVGAINKVSPFDDIPKIPNVGETAARTSQLRAQRGGLQFAGAPAGIGGPIVVNTTTNLTLDGEPVARNTTKNQQKNQRRNPRAKSGPNSSFR